MRILMVSSFLPCPLTSGGHVRLYNLIKGLSKNHEITLVCEKRSYQTKEDISFLEKITKRVITIDRKKQWSLKNILKTGFSFYPFLITGHTNSVIRKTLEEILEKEKFDLIHVETFYIMQNLPLTDLPIVLAEHNVEYLVYQRFANLALPPVRPLLFLDVLKMKYWEKKMWRKATKLIAVSEQERKLMGKDAEIVPNGVDTDKYQVSSIKYQVSKRKKRILFIGDFRWMQNRDAVSWLLKEIWPKIVQSSKFKVQSLLKLWIVGREIPDSIRKLGGDDVLFDENADDAIEIFKKADVLISPVRVGGGTSFKILEAMASGVPVISTSLGIEGIDAEDGKEVLIGNTAEEIAKHVIEILENNNLYEKIIKNARKLIEEKYDWEEIIKKLESVYYSVIR